MKLDSNLLKSILTNAVFDYKKENIYCKCPWCGHNEFGISLKDNHVFNCFRKAKCGEVGNIYKLLKKLDRLDLLGNNGIQSIKYSEKLEDIITKKIEEQNLDLTLPTISAPLGWRRVFSNEYLENRNFSSFQKYEVGITKLDQKLKDHVIFLLRQNGEIKGYIARRAQSASEIKRLEKQTNNHISRYRNSSTDFTKMLVGEEEITINTTTIILVEGLFGKENVDKILGLDDQEDIKCCSTSGAKISDEQIFKLQLKGIKHIILFFDIDVINKIKKHSLHLLNEFESVRIVYTNLKNTDGSYKDPADLMESEMWEVFDNPIDPINFYFNKIQVLKLK